MVWQIRLDNSRSFPIFSVYSIFLFFFSLSLLSGKIVILVMVKAWFNFSSQNRTVYCTLYSTIVSYRHWLCRIGAHYRRFYCEDCWIYLRSSSSSSSTGISPVRKMLTQVVRSLTATTSSSTGSELHHTTPMTSIDRCINISRCRDQIADNNESILDKVRNHQGAPKGSSTVNKPMSMQVVRSLIATTSSSTTSVLTKAPDTKHDILIQGPKKKKRRRGRSIEHVIINANHYTTSRQSFTAHILTRNRPWVKS